MQDRGRLQSVAMPKAKKSAGREQPPQMLKGWQAIGSYLGVGAAIAQRWAKSSGMPVKKEGRFTVADVDELRRWLGRLAFGQLSCALGQRFRRYPVSTALPRSLPRNDRRPPAFGALENMPRQVGFVHLRSPKDHCALRKTKIRWRINRKRARRFQIKTFN